MLIFNLQKFIIKAWKNVLNALHVSQILRVLENSTCVLMHRSYPQQQDCDLFQSNLSFFVFQMI